MGMTAWEKARDHFGGQTPDEMFMGTDGQLVDELAARRLDAKETRRSDGGANKLRIFNLIQQSFKFSDGLKIFGTPSGALRTNECGQRKNPYVVPEHGDEHGLLKHLLIGSASCHFTEKIQVSQICGESEIETSMNCCSIKTKRKPRRGAA